jgi:diguanylate cyclase (GGDEF)-like protein/PAS domain S-box-containing protein
LLSYPTIDRMFSTGSGTIKSWLGVIKCDTSRQHISTAARSRTKISHGHSYCDSHFTFILPFGLIKRMGLCLALMDQKSDRETRLFSETRRKLAMYGKRLIVRHALLSLIFLVLYVLLTRPDILMETHLGFIVWYPANGLALALMLGISPWYAPLVCIADVMSGAMIYHQPLASWGQAFGSPAHAAIYAAAAIILRGPLRIDLGLNHRRDVVRYVFVTLVAAVSSTGIGVACLVADHTISWNQFWPAAFSWFNGDSIAFVGVAPFLLIHVFPWVRRQILLSITQSTARTKRPKEGDAGLRIVVFAEAVGQGASIVLLLWIMFGRTLGPLQLLYLSFVPILWIAMRHGIRRASAGVLALDFGIVVALRIFPPDPSTLPKVGILMLVVSFTGLIVGSAVSERHRIGRELHEQTSYLNSLIENTPLGVVVLDRDHRVQLCNDAFEKLFLYPRDELVGTELDSRISLADARIEAQELTARVASGRRVQQSARRARKDGKLIDVELNAVPLVEDGEVRGSFAIYKDISEQTKAQEQARQDAHALNQLVAELQLRTTQMALLNEMGDLLQCCAGAEEAYVVVAQSVRKLLPAATAGILYVFKSSRNAVEAAAVWGNSRASEPIFAPEMCWALRRGQPHWSEYSTTGITCQHLKDPNGSTHLCVPMVGQGETLGMLHLEFANDTSAEANIGPESIQQSRQRLAATVAGQVALSLASLRLRETLRDQSIRDSLTGLFNRRFMQESLDRELQRARRKKRPLAVVFLDLDHFKRFNDSFGHDAGDTVLRRIAEVFRQHFRGDDVICRYGGEEFAIILPEATAKDAAKRANLLRLQAKKLRFRHQDQTLDPVTLSIGVAAFPEHGSTSEELLQAADQCLYQSKSEGRDRVTVATPQKV